ncbi:MAG: Shikimate kinase I, partial [uncultured Phycisphaerae bacterium]
EYCVARLSRQWEEHGRQTAGGPALAEVRRHRRARRPAGRRVDQGHLRQSRGAGVPGDGEPGRRRGERADRPRDRARRRGHPAGGEPAGAEGRGAEDDLPPLRAGRARQADPCRPADRRGPAGPDGARRRHRGGPQGPRRARAGLPLGDDRRVGRHPLVAPGRGGLHHPAVV